MEPVKIVLVTQARTGSSRLPSKVLLKVQNKTLLEIHLERLKQSKTIDQIIVATTIKEEDIAIVDICKNMKLASFRGDENNVLDRYYQATKNIKPEWIIRVTSDCPLIDPALIDAVVMLAIVNDVDYCSNSLIERFPDGQDIEVFKFSVLEKAWKEASLNSEKEHVTPYIRNNVNDKGKQLFKALNFPCFNDYSGIRMTVDVLADFELIKKLIDNYGTQKTWLTYTENIITQNLQTINHKIIRNEGLLKSLKND